MQLFGLTKNVQPINLCQNTSASKLAEINDQAGAQE
jgi:hypothetical protein